MSNRVLNWIGGMIFVAIFVLLVRDAAADQRANPKKAMPGIVGNVLTGFSRLIAGATQ